MVRREKRENEQGSALVLALFVIVMLGMMGTALLAVTQREMQANRSGLGAKQAYFLAEAGVEDSRTRLYNVNGNGSFSNDLLAAAGPNGVIDFDPQTAQATYDAAGNFTGFSGYGDDVPLTPLTVLGAGRYMAFLANDAAEGRTLASDTNFRVVVAGIAAGPRRSFEVDEAILELDLIIPAYPPATITLLGPPPSFTSANSGSKVYQGADCGGSGIPGLYVPTVGAIGSTGEAAAESGMQRQEIFQSGAYSGSATVADLTDNSEPLVHQPLDPMWQDCAALRDMVERFRTMATVTCPDGSRLSYSSGSGKCVVPSPSMSRVIFANGDFDASSNAGEQGLLVVTGHLRMTGNTSWRGLVVVVGEGSYEINGAGNGVISGGVILADIAGPDNVYGTGDDCTGPAAGLSQVSYDESGGGNSGTVYCTNDVLASLPPQPYPIVSFRQH